MSIEFVKKVIYIKVGESMQTSGTVLLNARGVNINGYDCFVNLSKDTLNLSFDLVPSWNPPPVSGNDRIYDETARTYNKFSNCSFKHGNNYMTNIYFSNSFPVSTFTASYWVKAVKLTPIPSGIASKYISTIYAIGCVVGDSNLFIPRNGDSSAIWMTNESLSFNGSVTSFDDNWHHVANVLVNGRRLGFLDGVKICDGSNKAVSGEAINRICLRDYCQYCYMDDLVIIKDQALWTSNFTPPSDYLLDSEYTMDLDQVRRRNIIAANVDKKLIIPDEPLKQY